LIVGAAYGVDYCPEKGLFSNSETDLALIFNGNDYTLGFVANRIESEGADIASIKLAYSQKLNDKTNAGVGFKVLTNNNLSLTLASCTQLDNDSSLRSRVLIKNTKNLNVGLVYQQKLSNLVNVSLGVDVDTTAVLSGIKGNHEFQLKFNLLD